MANRTQNAALANTIRRPFKAFHKFPSFHDDSPILTTPTPYPRKAPAGPDRRGGEFETRRACEL